MPFALATDPNRAAECRLLGSHFAGLRFGFWPHPDGRIGPEADYRQLSSLNVLEGTLFVFKGLRRRCEVHVPRMRERS
jgi:hypothetical protein